MGQIKNLSAPSNKIKPSIFFTPPKRLPYAVAIGQLPLARQLWCACPVKRRGNDLASCIGLTMRDYVQKGESA